MRFSSDALTVRNLYGSYAIIRWRDRWGTWWEHKRGEVRPIDESESLDALTKAFFLGSYYPASRSSRV